MAIDETHSLELLDFYRVRSALAGYCASPEGAALVEGSLPSDDPELVKTLKEDVSLLVAELREREPPQLFFPDAAKGRRILSKEGTVLEIAELYDLGLWAKAYEALLSWMPGGAPKKTKGGKTVGETLGDAPGASPVSKAVCETVGDAPGASPDAEEDPDGWARARLAAIIEGAPRLDAVISTVFAVLSPEGELKDLPALRKIREGIQRADRELRALAESFFRDPDLKPALQSGEPTLRDGRTVLAIRANFRGRVKGIVHEVSATGQTVFIEPAALVDKNNELVQLDAAMRAETLRILRETTEKLHAMRHGIREAAGRLAAMDARFSRALHCLRGGNVMARDLESGFSLIKGRHPLLGNKAVPIDVDLPKESRTLIVTGPNTGGKTVTLKTIGLFALMNQFGMGLPAASETGFAVFDGIWADIGDEQSIDQSLSTFSGHMRVLGRIADRATAGSLVLLDELGAGTDPEEGCAVAMGLLDHFIDRGSLTVVTTHHGILKNYGYTRPGCLNASMDFDAKSLSPTYRIVMGVPGESRALDIAAQNGLAPDIVKSARRYLSDERTDVSELIKGLNEKHRELDVMERERKRRLKAAVEDQRKADLAGLRVRRQEIELRRKGVSDLQKLLGESRKTLENLVRELRESGADALRTKEVKRFLADLAEAAEGQRDLLGGIEDSVAEAGAEAIDETETPSRDGARSGAEILVEAAAKPLGPGDSVLVGHARRKGTVLRAAGKGKWLVEAGSLRLTVSEKELVRAAAPDSPSVPQYQVELAPRGESGAARAVFELDLRGFRLAEALVATEKQIDAAALQNLSLFSIIHGTGEGILGKGIHDYLKGNPAVADYHFARPEEGGYGKTVVRLK
ncbi:MAG: Smr/MutS family protein [Rectinema sp.]